MCKFISFVYVRKFHCVFTLNIRTGMPRLGKSSRKHAYIIVKLGFTGVYIIFLIFAQTIDCGYSLEPPRGGGSNEYPQSMF